MIDVIGAFLKPRRGFPRRVLVYQRVHTFPHRLFARLIYSPYLLQYSLSLPQRFTSASSLAIFLRVEAKSRFIFLVIRPLQHDLKRGVLLAVLYARHMLYGFFRRRVLVYQFVQILPHRALLLGTRAAALHEERLERRFVPLIYSPYLLQYSLSLPQRFTSALSLAASFR